MLRRAAGIAKKKKKNAQQDIETYTNPSNKLQAAIPNTMDANPGNTCKQTSHYNEIAPNLQGALLEEQLNGETQTDTEGSGQQSF